MTDPNAYWNGPAGDRWVREQAALDDMLRPFGEAALDAARVSPGEAVVDVGCGCGATSLALASLVGARGRVVGLDVSAPMLRRARERAVDCPNVSLRDGDAAREFLGASTFDLVFSRFGVMFFADPWSAFAHLRTALRSGGRLAFVCWKALGENPWAAIPFDAVAHVLGRPDPEPADAPGPFSLGDEPRLRSLLDGAGFRDVKLAAFRTTLAFGASGAIDDAVSEISRVGPVARLLVDRDEASMALAHAAIKAVVSAHTDTHGVVALAAAAWIVTATNGG
jgi:SAM-dependent methyltransferase